MHREQLHRHGVVIERLVKFGTASTGPFTNVTFVNCLVQNTAHYLAMAVESVDGSSINNVTFSNITFTGCQNAIFIVLGSRSGATIGSVNNIQFHNITGSAMSDTRGCPISGCLTNGVTYKLQNILFDNVNISFEGGVGSIPGAPPEYAGQYPENTMWGNLPAYGYYLRHVTGVTFTNCLWHDRGSGRTRGCVDRDERCNGVEHHRADFERAAAEPAIDPAMDEPLRFVKLHQRCRAVYGHDRRSPVLIRQMFQRLPAAAFLPVAAIIRKKRGNAARCANPARSESGRFMSPTI